MLKAGRECGAVHGVIHVFRYVGSIIILAGEHQCSKFGAADTAHQCGAGFGVGLGLTLPGVSYSSPVLR